MSDKFIIDGKQMSGPAMSKIMAGFQKAVVGKKILAAGYLEIEGEAWPALKLDDGSYVWASRDDEQNGAGVLMADSDGDSPCPGLCETAFK